MAVASMSRRACTTAASLRSRYLTSSAINAASGAQRTAVVVGATSGIGEACADRLAEQGFLVVAVGRDRPGRAEKVVAALTAKSANAVAGERGEGGGGGSGNDDEPAKATTTPKHEFRPCDAFSLSSISKTARSIAEDHPTIDALVLTQGMATTQSFTPTADEGNDEKLTLHYWSRAAMAYCLLLALRRSTMEGGPVVLSVLSGGVHSAYKEYRTDPELRKNYSVSNAADFAGFYNDLGFDAMARMEGNDKINFVHACPGFVNTNWGTEFPWYLRGVVRAIQPLGKSAADCAEFMVGPTVLASDRGEDLPARPNGEEDGIIVMGQKGQSEKLTKLHTEEAREFVWKTTQDVMRKAGIEC